MNPIQLRRENDLKKLKELEKKFNFFKILSVEGNPTSKIQIGLYVSLPVLSGSIHKDFKLFIILPADYPLKMPGFSIKPPVFNPNVFSNGDICTGGKWLPSNTLDLETIRVLKILFYYPEVINLKSPANNEAVEWYSKNIQKFPLINLENIDHKKIKWKEL